MHELGKALIHLHLLLFDAKFWRLKRVASALSLRVIYDGLLGTFSFFLKFHLEVERRTCNRRSGLEICDKAV